MKNIRALRVIMILNAAAIILSAIALVIAFLAGIGIIDRGTPFSNGAIFFAMILNIFSNAVMLDRNAKNYLDESNKKDNA